MTVFEEDAGLHFLIKLDTALSDGELTQCFAEAGVKIRALSSFYHGAVPESDRKTLLVNYSGLDEDQLPRLKNVVMKG